MQEKQQENKESQSELILRVFQYSDYEYVIGFVDLNQLNSSDYAFTIHNVLSVTFESEIQDFVIFETTIIDSTEVYNLSKHKVISMFTPNIDLTEEYYRMANDIVEREQNNFEVELDDEDQYLNNFLQIGKIQ